MGKKSVRPKLLEDVPKMVSFFFKIAQKRSQNDPKMAQDWLKLRKIAPKTAQDSPKWVHKGSQNDPKTVHIKALKGLKRPYKAL